MIESTPQWNSLIKSLKDLLKKGKDVESVRSMVQDLHGYTHSREVRGGAEKTREDEFWDLCTDESLRKLSEKQLYSPAWHLWHSARIEDICCSTMLMEREELLYSGGYDELLSVPFLHTGNSMGFADMEIFNSRISSEILREYRDGVGKRTQQALVSLTFDLLDSKVTLQSLETIRQKGSVSEDDRWLLEFWGRKKIGGIVSMPLTRHLLVHVNSAIRLL